MRVAEVILPMPLPEAFDYAVPEGLDLAPGDHVLAPLGPRFVHGLVRALREVEAAGRPLKALAERLPLTPLPPKTLAFIEWAARWQASPPGDPLAMALRGLRAPLAPPGRRLAATGLAPGKPTPARLAVLKAAAAGSFDSAAGLARAAGVTAAVVRGLIDQGALGWTEAPPEPPPPLRLDPASLSAEQRAAADALERAAARGGFHVALLDGVTGSGKTEVYLEAVAAALRRDPEAQALILSPEIALTEAVTARLAERFGARPHMWHSGMRPPARRAVWEAAASGAARIVVGARSALFLPFRALSLIVVDEEHDGSFKQEEGFIYHARDLAVARARIEGAAVVLASATPSLETVWNAGSGRYGWLRLTSRHGEARLPQLRLIDLRADPPEPGRWLSPPLTAALGETLRRGEQSLLFLNRRGYAPLVLCRACGQRLTAPDTDSWLVEHRYTGRLVCHLTGFSMPRPERCPACGARESLTSVGPGVERIEEEARQLFPEARIAVFSSDTTPSAQEARALVERMERGEIDILVATQAAAKGHNFPNLTLVGIVDADLGLKGGDLRAAERTFQLLSQATGRAGRAARPGLALIQTHAPDNPVMQALAAADRDAFLEAELAEREAAGMPPFGRLAALILSGTDHGAVDAAGRTLARAAPNARGAEIYGPADAPLTLVRGRKRVRLLVRADREVDLQALLAAWLSRVRLPASVRLVVDVDPYSFL